MPPATKETTTPVPQLGEREPAQKPTVWKGPPYGNHLRIIITNNKQGNKHVFAISDKEHITWFKRDSGNLSIEERKEEERTPMALEVNDTSVNPIKTTVQDPRKTTLKTTIENI